MPELGRRNAVAALTALAVPALTARRADASGSRIIDAALARAEAGEPACGPRASAIKGTRSRLAAMSLPVSGRLVLVNVASQTLTAYRDGEPEFEMKVVVGAPRTRTPDLQTEVSYVRFNPTWTVPASIVREREFQRGIATPGWLARNDFRVTNGVYVQQPGPRNALGRLKIGLRNSGAIYLHDTNERGRFAAEHRALSHGCVRLHDPFALAAWVLGIEEDEARAAQQAGDRTNRTGFGQVHVVIGYFTAFPDADGEVAVFEDVYRRDPPPVPCPGEA